MTPEAAQLVWHYRKVLYVGGQFKVYLKAGGAPVPGDVIATLPENPKTYVLPGLLPSTTYYWKVEVFQGANSKMSEVRTFTTGAASTPPAIPATGRILHLDPTVGVTVVGAGVTSWADQSGRGNNVTQATVANQPTLVPAALNGKPVLGFDGTQWLETATGTDFGVGAGDVKVFSVSKNTVAKDYSAIYGDRDPTTRNGFYDAWYQGAVCPYLRFDGSVISYGTSPVNRLNTWALSENGRTAGIHKCCDSGVNYYTAAFPFTMPVNPMAIGAWKPEGQAPYNHEGQIAEILMYNRALTAQEEFDARKNLTLKYALPAFDVLAPAVIALSPASNADVSKEEDLILRARVLSAPGATVSSVEFFVNGVSVGTETTATGWSEYSMTWAPPAVGAYTIVALATDSNGLMNSASVTVNSVEMAPNIAFATPSPTMSASRPVDFPTTFTAVNSAFALTADKVTLAASEGSVTGTVSIVAGLLPRTPIIRVTGITGFGRLRVCVLAGAGTSPCGLGDTSAGVSPAAGVFPPLPDPPSAPAAGSKLWWDASNINGSNNAGLTNGQLITSWKDKSGNNNNGTPTGAGATYAASVAGFNNKPAVTFHGDKANEKYNFAASITDVRTVFWAIQAELGGTRGYHYILGANTSWGDGYGWNCGQNEEMWDRNYAMPEILNGVTRVNGLRVDGTRTSLYPYGHAIVSLETAGLAQADFFSGDARPDSWTQTMSWKGDLAELIIYNRVLTADERNTTGRYLAGKYAKDTVFGYPDVPAVTLVYPAGPAAVPLNTPVALKATAVAGSGSSIATMEFYVDWELVGTDTTPNAVGEYLFTWTAPGTVGSHEVFARALDNHTPALAAISAVQTIAVVNPLFATVTGEGTKDGSSWANAMTLDEAFTAAGAASSEAVIYIKAGTYTRAASYKFTKGAALYGGFAGTETLPAQRTGTPGVDNVTTLDAGGTVEGIFHNGGQSVTLDRLTFTRSADTAVTLMGGANTVNNCTFTNNTAVGPGGGIRTEDRALGTTNVTRSVFKDNTAGGYWGGGGMGHYYGTAILDSCWFENNQAIGANGGAFCNFWGDLIVTNSVFVNNSADGGGGAIYGGGSGAPAWIFNSTFVGNQSTGTDFSGIWGEEWWTGYGIPVFRVVNSIFSTHAGQTVGTAGGPKYMQLQNNLFFNSPFDPTNVTESGTVTGDPKFVSATDFHLQSTSPAINAGTTDAYTIPGGSNLVVAYRSRDYAGLPRSDGWPDLGAYEAILPWIVSPRRSGQILAGDTLRFAAGSLRGDCRWDFGDGRESTLQAPGLVTFPTPGEQTIKLYATDAQGQNDILVATRTLTVAPDPGAVPDLAVLALDIPPGLEINESSAAILYTVRNDGDAALTGASWTDAIYLSDDPYLDVYDMLLTSATVAQDLAVGQSYQGSLVLTVPAVAGAPWYLILSADDEWAVLERHQLNNERAALLNVSVPELEDGTGRTVSFDAGPIADYHKIEVPSGQNLLLRLDASLAGLRVYVRFGALPTEGMYDYVWDGSDLLIPAAAAGTWYILVFDDSAPEAGEYTIEFETVELKLLSVSPPSLGEAAPMELTLTGVGFAKPIQVELAAAGGGTYSAGTVEVDSFTQITASFAAGSVPAGVYTVRVSQTGGASSELPDAFEVTAGGEAHLETNLILPATVGYHTPATLYVEYRNTGTVAMLAPLLTLTASQNGREAAILTLDKTRLSQGFWTSAMPVGYANSVQFVASGENLGVLQPGESRRMAVYYAGWLRPWDWSFPPIQWNVGVLRADDTTAVDWPELRAGMRPSYVREDAWDAVWANVTAQAGSTWGDYMAMLDRNAVYLNRLGQRVEDIRYLLSFSFRVADALSPIRYLAGADDALVQAPGLPIAFHRVFAQPISRRYELGPLGRGWAHNWQISLVSETDGTVVITDMTGTPRIFQPDRRYTDKYLAQPGDQGALTAVGGGGWSLRESDGLVLAFLADGKLDHVEDTNGNRVTCSYGGDLLSDLTHSSGQFLHLAYNAAGRIASVTDDSSRQTLYTYSADGEHLVSTAAYDGRTTTYAYSVGQGAAKEHALTEIAFPGGTHQYFTYDAQGRLASTSRDNGAEAVAFSYDSMGTVAATDALNNTSRFFFDHWGRVAKSEDALGRAVLMAFDDLGNPTGLTDPAGHTQTYAYDSRCNLIRSTDPLRHTTQFAWSREFNRLGSVTDANGNRTAYSYDGTGNLAAITYADGNRETWTCDAQGNPAAWTNRRGHAVGYTFDTDGRVTRKTYPGGSQVDYTYDARGNLTQAVDAYGTTAFTYDSNDYLTRIVYPGGRRLEFTYDAAGRRASSLDQLGRRLDYHYDAAGRLDLMTNESSAQVVQYEYDAAGRLSRKTVGNGVYTTYEYDDAGQLTRLVNRKPNDDVLSSFEYTYDSRGRRTAMDTHYGLWTYQYDDTGQLVRAVLDSTDAGIPDQDLTYVYDALGNRIYTLVNGVREDYVTNNMNQYVEVGDRTYTFDADGNLTQETGPGGTTVYTYNDENRLVGVARGADTWQYTYDALGNRVAVSENGAVTHYVIDPIGLGNVVGEYNASGGLIARYDHGFGLLDRVDGGGNPAYYTFDAIGSAHELTIAAGAVANAYGYEPYGASLKNTRVVPNPFEFVGEYGVMRDGDALSYMRAREFAPGIGRFISSDPLGPVGDDVNLYRYAGNNPLSLSDPAGLACRIKWKSEDLVPLVTVPAKHVLSQNGKEERIGGAPSGDSPLFWRCRRQASVDLKYCYYSQKPVTPPPAPSGGDASTSQTTGTTGPVDPNGKLGPSGFGAENYVTGEEPFAYRVDFENDPAASAPAQIVNVADALSPNLDWTTFELTEIGFGDQLVTVPSGLQHFEKAVPFTFNDVDFEVRIEAGIHADSGKAYVNFYSIDPGTELPPAASVGFLPPEDGTGRGMGHVSYIVRPKAGLATGTAIRNVATIQFNFGETIATNQVDAHDPSQGTDPDKEALVTIDAGVPESQVLALPAVTTTRAFQVSWTGEDDTGGSGVAGYDVFVRDNSGPWTLWLNAAASQTSAVFTGADGHTYGFYSVATDNVGHREPAPAQADATTRVEVKNTGSFAAEWWRSYR